MRLPNPASIQLFLARLSKREKAVLYGAAIVVSLTALDRLVIFPIFYKMEELGQEIKDSEAGIKKSLHILTYKDKIMAASIKYKTYIKAARSVEEEMTTFLKEVENLASANSVYLIDMKPGEVAEGAASKKYLLNVNCEAQLEQLVEFMYNVERSDKLLTIEKYKINPKSKESSVARCSISIAKTVVP